MKNRSVISVILLSIVTCGIYSIYWSYKFYKKIDRVIGGGDNAVLNFILGIFLTPIVGMDIAQNQINHKY